MRKHLTLFGLLLAAASLRIAWAVYTRHTYEDAFITFRFARNLASGLGFVYNANEPIYGTTSPLFAVMMAAWLKLFPDLIVLGATTLGLLAGLLSIGLVWSLLGELSFDTAQRFVVAGALALSDKIWVHDTGGLETPLVICAMMACFLLLLRGRWLWAGVVAGGLLWLRVDGVFWVCVLAAGAWYLTRRLPATFLAAAFAVYLPWCVFAALYFGSPIPYTIYAKWVAYYVPLEPSLLLQRVETLGRWLTPFSLTGLPTFMTDGVAVLTIAVAAIGAIAYRRRSWLLVLAAFCLAEAVRLVATGETFETRYFMPLYWGVMILFGLGLCAIGARLAARRKRNPVITILAAAIYAGAALWFAVPTALASQQVQYFLSDASLKPMGIWLDRNTPPNATVFTEPLGYVGYYSNRRMLDEVGLVAPQVVALKRAGADTFALIAALDPDYIVLHCDDALRAPAVFLAGHTKEVEFNPLHFAVAGPGQSDPDPLSPAAQDLARTACYQVWRR